MQDLGADTGDCGDGNDVVIADTIDTVAGCEAATIPPAPLAPDGTKPVPTFSGAKVKGNKLQLKAGCPGTELRCSGDSVLKATGKVNGKKAKVKLGAVLVVVNGGDTEKLEVDLTGAQKRALNRLDKAKLSIAYDVVDAAGNLGKGTVEIKLRT